MLIMIVTNFSALKCMARGANNLIILLETVTVMIMHYYDKKWAVCGSLPIIQQEELIR